MDPDLTHVVEQQSKDGSTKATKSADTAAMQLALMQAFVAVIVFIPFMGRPWAPFAASLTGYSVLVFGLAFRDAECSLRKPQVRRRLPVFLLLHMLSLAAVYCVVIFSIRLNSQLPTFMTKSGLKGSLFEWIVTFALVMLAWAQEHWMRVVMRRDQSEG